MIFFSFYKKYMQSVKGKLILNVILIHAVLMSLVVFDLTQREQKFIEDQLSQKANALTSVLASNASVSLLNNDLVALNELLLDMFKIKDQYMIFILDSRGRVKASTNSEYFHRFLDDETSRNLFNKLLSSSESSYQIKHHNVLDTLQSITLNNNTVGYVRTLLDKSSLDNEIDIITKKGLVYIALAILLGAFFSWLAVRKITNRLNLVAHAANEIANNNFNISIPPSKTNDELSKMINAFNIMSKSINGYIDKQLQSESRLLEAQKIAHIGSWELDLVTSKMKWSPELYRIFNEDENTYEPTLESYFSNLAGEDLKRIEKAISQSVTTGRKIELDLSYNIDETKKHLHFTGRPYYDDGNAYKITGTIQDVTKYKE